MLFKGTKTRTTNAIAQSVQDDGGYINAYTSFDRTVYWIDVPKEGVTSALDILSDAMMNSTLPPEEYAKEQEVIRREFAMGYDDPDRMMGQLMFKTAYQRHPYRLPVIGEIQIFDQLTQQDVMRVLPEPLRAEQSDVRRRRRRGCGRRSTRSCGNSLWPIPRGRSSRATSRRSRRSRVGAK